VVAEPRGRQREAGARDLPQLAVRSSFMTVVILTKDLKGLSFFVVSVFSARLAIRRRGGLVTGSRVGGKTIAGGSSSRNSSARQRRGRSRRARSSCR
jgi:hypothetical protein